MYDMVLIGQVNGKFKELGERIISSTYENTTFIQCGNFVLTDLVNTKNNIDLKMLNQILIDRNSNLMIIRGNHDNPNIFLERNSIFSNIELIPDFTEIMIENRKLLLFGGGISVDRIERNKSGLYWENEKVSYPFERVNEFKGIDIIVSHKPIPYIFDGFLNDFIDFWVKGDACLENQLSKERDEAKRFINSLKKNNNIKEFISSHLNISAQKTVEGTKHISLAELEFWILNSGL